MASLVDEKQTGRPKEKGDPQETEAGMHSPPVEGTEEEHSSPKQDQVPEKQKGLGDVGVLLLSRGIHRDLGRGELREEAMNEGVEGRPVEGGVRGGRSEGEEQALEAEGEEGKKKRRKAASE